MLVLEIPTVKTGRQDSFSRRQSSGTDHYGGKSDSLFAAETQQIEHEHDDEHEHERRSISQQHLAKVARLSVPKDGFGGKKYSEHYGKNMSAATMMPVGISAATANPPGETPSFPKEAARID